MKSFFALSACAIIALGGCATRPSEITASYVDPGYYRSLDCDQIAASGQAVSQQAAEAAGIQKKKADSDAALIGVSLILFWPAAFFTSRSEGTELAHLKGQMNAIEQVAMEKQCPIQFEKI